MAGPLERATASSLTSILAADYKKNRKIILSAFPAAGIFNRGAINAISTMAPMARKKIGPCH
jgi:hypothetical protein